MNFFIKAFLIIVLSIPHTAYSKDLNIPVEALLVRIEHFDTSDQYMVTYKQCANCQKTSRRVDSSARIQLNNRMSSMSTIYLIRHSLLKTIDLAYSNESGKIVWLNAMEGVK